MYIYFVRLWKGWFDLHILSECHILIDIMSYFDQCHICKTKHRNPKNV